MSITPLPTPPTKSDPLNFSARADAFVAALPLFVTEANQLALTPNIGESSGSSLVGYMPEGAGARDTNVQGKLREGLSLFDYIPKEERAAITAGTSTYDCTEAVQAALTAAAGKTLLVNPYKYKITGPLNGLSNTRLVGYGATFDISTVPDGLVGTDRCILDFCGSYGATIALTADALTTDNIVEIADTSGFIEGDLVQIWMNSAGRFPDPSIGVTSGQLNVVTGVYTGKLVLDTLIFDNMTVSNGASIRKITPVEDVFVEGLSFKGRGRRSAAYNDDRAVSVRFGRNANITNCKFVDVDLWAARLESCYFGSITGCQATTQKLNTTDKISYAFIYSSSQYITVSKNKAVNYRHGVVSSHLSASAFTLKYHGVSRFITIIENHITGNYGQYTTAGWLRAHAGIATHTDAQFVTISNNNVTGCKYGVNLRSLNMTATGNILAGNLYGVYLSEEFNHIKIDNNLISDSESGVICSTDVRSTSVTQLLISNNIVSNCKVGVNVYSDNGATNSGLSVLNNSFTDITNTVGVYPGCIVVNTSFKGLVTGNAMTNCDVHGIVTNGIQYLYVTNNSMIDMKSEASVATRYGAIFRTISPETVVKDNFMRGVDAAFGNPTYVQILSNMIGA